jgi:hypothetical protein
MGRERTFDVHLRDFSVACRYERRTHVTVAAVQECFDLAGIEAGYKLALWCRPRQGPA